MARWLRDRVARLRLWWHKKTFPLRKRWYLRQQRKGMEMYFKAQSWFAKHGATITMTVYPSELGERDEPLVEDRYEFDRSVPR